MRNFSSLYGKSCKLNLSSIKTSILWCPSLLQNLVLFHQDVRVRERKNVLNYQLNEPITYEARKNYVTERYVYGRHWIEFIYSEEPTREKQFPELVRGNFIFILKLNATTWPSSILTYRGSMRKKDEIKSKTSPRTAASRTCIEDTRYTLVTFSRHH